MGAWVRMIGTVYRMGGLRLVWRMFHLVMWRRVVRWVMRLCLRRREIC